MDSRDTAPGDLIVLSAPPYKGIISFSGNVYEEVEEKLYSGWWEEGCMKKVDERIEEEYYGDREIWRM